ncbi:MAG: MBL fold metallo-hydrolase [Bacilli bacterium]|nr:MBL fold metallo-hydrolase [Bacilli bacterium]
MQVETLVLGQLSTNCYLIKKGKDVLIIDPADDALAIISACNGYNVVGILVTHHHFDHIGALNELEKNYDLTHNFFDIPTFDFEVIKTPGHTDDSISFYFKQEKLLFSGDFIFKEAVGRCDFPESSEADMIESLNMISTYPDDIIIYPGHGPITTLKDEKQNFKYYF